MRINIIASNGARQVPYKGQNWGNNYSFTDSRFKFDKIFMMDGINGLSKVREGEYPREAIVDVINEHNFELITPFYEKGITKSMVYPLKTIKDKYNILYFKSTIAYQLAYAALQEPKEVHLYGINQSGHIEYLWERPAVEYWIGVLSGQGCKVVSHDPESRLFGGRPVFGGRVLYGYEQEEEEALNISKKNENLFKKSR